MTTFFIPFDNDNYYVEAVGLTIFLIKKNNKPTLFRYCPVDVQEQITATLENNILRDSDNPYSK